MLITMVYLASETHHHFLYSKFSSLILCYCRFLINSRNAVYSPYNLVLYCDFTSLSLSFYFNSNVFGAPSDPYYWHISTSLLVSQFYLAYYTSSLLYFFSVFNLFWLYLIIYLYSVCVFLSIYLQFLHVYSVTNQMNLFFNI